MGKVLLVDDELYDISGFTAALSDELARLTERAELVLCDVADLSDKERKNPENAEVVTALEFFKSESTNIRLAILDVMLDNLPQSGWSDAGDDGERGGIVLAAKLREYRPNLRVLFLTNQRDGIVLSEIRKIPNSRYIDKREIDVEPFVKLVLEELRVVRAQANSRGSDKVAQ